MKATLAFLLGVLVVSYSQTTTDSPESIDDPSSEVGTMNSDSHDGVGVALKLNTGTDDSPAVCITTDKDDEEYCLVFETLYEAIFDDDTCKEDCAFTLVDGSTVELGSSDATCTGSQDATTGVFTLVCTQTGGFAITLEFDFVTSTTEPGVEYSIVLEEYTFVSTDSNAKLVIDQSITEEAESESGDDDEGDDEDGGDDNEDRRRLGESGDDDESNSEEESDGVSSDDSNEVDVGAVTFRLSQTEGTCFDVDTSVDPATETEQTEKVNVKVIFASADTKKEVQLVIDRFDCDKFVNDPFVGLDFGKIGSGAYGVQTVAAFVLMSFMMVFWI